MMNWTRSGQPIAGTRSASTSSSGHGLRDRLPHLHFNSSRDDWKWVFATWSRRTWPCLMGNMPMVISSSYRWHIWTSQKHSSKQYSGELVNLNPLQHVQCDGECGAGIGVLWVWSSGLLWYHFPHLFQNGHLSVVADLHVMGNISHFNSENISISLSVTSNASLLFDAVLKINPKVTHFPSHLSLSML
jgi:hypothetical protein